MMCLCFVLFLEWSRETLLESWIDDPIGCCDKCGVVPPASVLDHPSQYFTLSSSKQGVTGGSVVAKQAEHELATPLPETPTTTESEPAIEVQFSY